MGSADDLRKQQGSQECPPAGCTHGISLSGNSYLQQLVIEKKAPAEGRLAGRPHRSCRVDAIAAQRASTRAVAKDRQEKNAELSLRHTVVTWSRSGDLTSKRDQGEGGLLLHLALRVKRKVFLRLVKA